MKIKVTDKKKYAKVRKVEFDSSIEVDEWGKVDNEIHVHHGEYISSTFGKWSADKYEDKFGFVLTN
jgi:hypothetical protein